MTGLARAADLEDPGGVATALVLLDDGACVGAKLDDSKSVRTTTLVAVERLIDGHRPVERRRTCTKAS